MKALLFDLDDTLLDYSGDVELSWAAACRSHCTAVVDADRLIAAVTEQRRTFWVDPEKNRRERVNMLGAWQKIAGLALASCGCADDDLAVRIADDYAARRRQRMQLFPESLACLDALRARGLPLGLVTNGDANQQRDKIDRHRLASYFGAIVIEGEFGVGKPDEKVFRAALATLGRDPRDAWMVGDNLEFDIEGAQRLGIRAAWIDRAGTGVPDGTAIRPDRIIRSLNELV